MWAGREALAEESNSGKNTPSFTAFLPLGIAPPLTACQYPTHLSRLSPNTFFYETILDSSLPAGLLRLCLQLSSLMKDPSYSAPSFEHIHTASLSSWGVRCVH